METPKQYKVKKVNIESSHLCIQVLWQWFCGEPEETRVDLPSPDRSCKWKRPRIRSHLTNHQVSS